ncbi:MAG: PPC domain-containing protein [bacterium]
MHSTKQLLAALALAMLMSSHALADEGGSSCTTAPSISLGGRISGAINPAGDQDYFRYVITSAGILDISTTGSTDTFGALYDGSCRAISGASNDDGEGSYGYNFHISIAVSPGTYYIRVRHYSSSGTGSYSLVSGFSGGPSGGQDWGSSCSTAFPVTLNSSNLSSIEFPGDADSAVVTVPRTGTLTVYTTGSTDTYGILRDGGCNVITSNDDGGGSYGLNFAIRASVGPGTYYVKIRHYSASGTGSYFLNLSF